MIMILKTERGRIVFVRIEKCTLSRLQNVFQARNMRKFKIVVTERGRREMAEAEEEKNKKRDKKASA